MRYGCAMAHSHYAVTSAVFPGASLALAGLLLFLVLVGCSSPTAEFKVRDITGSSLALYVRHEASTDDSAADLRLRLREDSWVFCA